ncbi:hypothetical protein DV737_g3919, partial [Chaetothyriales sp. CBS 132003]
MAEKPNRLDQLRNDNKSSQESSPVQTWGTKSKITKAIQRFRTWPKRKAPRSQSTSQAHSNDELVYDLVGQDLTKNPPPYYHDPTLDLPQYHDLPLNPEAAAALTAISTAISLAAAVEPSREVVPLINDVAVTIAKVAKVAATAPITQSIMCSTRLPPAVPNVANTIVAKQAMRRPNTSGFCIDLDPATSNDSEIWDADHPASRQTKEEIFPFRSRRISIPTFYLPVSSAPALTSALNSALLNVIKAVISTPAPSKIAVAEAYGSYAGHIARGVAQGITATGTAGF